MNLAGDNSRTDHAIGEGSCVSGGFNNNPEGLLASISGGENNFAHGDYASVSGGRANFADGEHSSVSGGGYSTASGDEASVSGGVGGLASGAQSSVSGGSGNVAEGGAALPRAVERVVDPPPVVELACDLEERASLDLVGVDQGSVEVEGGAADHRSSDAVAHSSVDFPL